MIKIGDNFNEELNSLFLENSQSGILRQIWEHDKNESKEQFSQDQKEINLEKVENVLVS